MNAERAAKFVVFQPIFELFVVVADCFVSNPIARRIRTPSERGHFRDESAYRGPFVSQCSSNSYWEQVKSPLIYIVN